MPCRNLEENHYDQQEKWGRLSLLRLSRDKSNLSYVVSLQGDNLIGKPAPKSDIVYEAVVKASPWSRTRKTAMTPGFKAYAPCAATRTARPTRSSSSAWRPTSHASNLT